MTRSPVSSRPDYPIPWIATYFIAALVLIAGSYAIVWYVSQFSSQYDYTDPDMTFLERIVLSPEPQRGDFTALNGGNWQALCLIGWQGDLEKAIFLAKLSQPSAKTLVAEYNSLASDALRSEFIIVYIDKSGAAKALKHPHGFAFARPENALCTTHSQPVLAIPAP